MPDDSSNTADDDNKKIRNLEKSSSSASQEPDLDDRMPERDETESPIGSYPKPDDAPEDELDAAKVRDFLEKKGAVEIFAQLADGPKRFSEIDEALVVSHGTISTRLTEGAKLNLWGEHITYPDDGGKIKLYDLESRTQHLATIAEEENIRQTTEQLRQANEQHADAVSAFRDRLQTDNSEP